MVNMIITKTPNYVLVVCVIPKSSKPAKSTVDISVCTSVMQLFH